VVSLTDIDSPTSPAAVSNYFTSVRSAEDSSAYATRGTASPRSAYLQQCQLQRPGTGAVTNRHLSVGQTAPADHQPQRQRHRRCSGAADPEPHLRQQFQQPPGQPPWWALRVYDGDGGTSNGGHRHHQRHARDGWNAAGLRRGPGQYPSPRHPGMAAAATLTDGSYVVAWQSDTQDGSSWAFMPSAFATMARPWARSSGSIH